MEQQHLVSATNKNVFLLLLFLGSLLLWGHVQARERDEAASVLKAEAYRAYFGRDRQVDLPRAQDLYRQAAERGDAEAQFIYGGMLYQGQGSDPDRRSGFKWLLKAAEQGKSSPESLVLIGNMFMRGAYVPQNYLEARKWLRQAAEQGNLQAQNNLAYLYFNGLGGEKDYPQAMRLYEQAALQGDAMAQANIGLMHATGLGGPVDRARGYAWYSLAASRGNISASINRNNLVTDMTWEELNQAQALSVELYRQVEKIDDPGLIRPEERE